MKHALAITALALALASCEQNRPTCTGEICDGWPPERFEADMNRVPVTFSSSVGAACEAVGLEQTESTITKGCSVSGGRNYGIIVSNPCKEKGSYAKLLCHELAHMNGWPADHPK